MPLNQFRRCLGLGLKSRPPIDNPGARLDSGMEGRFTGLIWQRLPEVLFFLVAMCASPFRNCACAERNHMGGRRRKRGSQRPRATLRREIHAAQEGLEAWVGASEIATSPGLGSRGMTIKVPHSSPLDRGSGRAKPGFP
jgi:hypothetical protein